MQALRQREEALLSVQALRDEAETKADAVAQLEAEGSKVLQPAMQSHLHGTDDCVHLQQEGRWCRPCCDTTDSADGQCHQHKHADA